ncbi:MAG: hypothetical protein Q9200_001554 [Gallowayella weberi]
MKNPLAEDVVADTYQVMRAQIAKAITYIDQAVDEHQDATIYNAFFSGVTPSVVRGILHRILVGGKVFSNTYQYNLPQVGCSGGRFQQMTAECRLIQPRTAYIESELKEERTKYTSGNILLCPGFFKQAAQPVQADCPILSTTRQRLSNSDIGAGTKTATLLHELIDMYLDEVSLQPEVDEINRALVMTVETKRINPPSYVFFVAAVTAGCHDFPRRFYGPLRTT